MFTQFKMQFQKYRWRLLALTMPAVLVLADPALAKGGDNVPCNRFLSGALGTVINPIIGSFVGLKTLALGLIVAAVVVGGLTVFTSFGRGLLKYGGKLAGILLVLGVVINVVGHYVHTRC